MRFLQQILVSRSFLVLLNVLLSNSFFFIVVYLMASTSNISKQLYFFLSLSKRSDDFLIWNSIPPVLFYFSTFHYQVGTFFNAKFHSYMLTIYSYCLYQGLQFLFIFGKYFVINYVHKVVYFFL